MCSLRHCDLHRCFTSCIHSETIHTQIEMETLPIPGFCPYFPLAIMYLGTFWTHEKKYLTFRTTNNRKINTFSFLKSEIWGPCRVAQLVGASSCAPKCCWFNSWSGHRPGLLARSLVGVHTGGYRSMFLSRRVCLSVSLPLSFPPFLPFTLSPSFPPSLSIKKSINISLDEDFFKKEWNVSHHSGFLSMIYTYAAC